MSTISNERLGAFILGSQPWNEEIEQMAHELLALRKERELAVPVGEVVLGEPDDEGNYPNAGVLCLAGDGCADWDNFPDGYKLYGRPPAQPFDDDSLPFDPQIAEYEQMMEAEQAEAATDNTSQQSESLAGKAVGGWIPCSERVPDFYYSCLAADEHGDMVIGLPNNLKVSYRKAFCLSGGELFFATHWQPLPEPPCK
ncbi:DUF551 domain-containing protein [Cronobacter dublinensis]|uniref:DUF551 domain-containing protein n=1 Tax=Cronobacter dublinensis TaxID=413497 RepID=UPI002894738C|nr:DUF551 domain-containing protein [Cronobacter dublinensis]MDT3605991.1 DUF551 domain-containing protein [Cronobacter dublinensis]